MPEKINIASLTIDFNDVIKKSAAYKKQIDGLKKAQKELDTTTEQGQQAHAKNAVEIKNLSKAYRDNQTFAAALESVNKDLAKTMSVENKSTQELRDSRRELNVISKNIIGNTEEEILLREELNVAIDEQTEALREQSSEFNSSKDQIGEYEQGIQAAFENMNIFNGGLTGFIQRSGEAGGTGKLFTQSLGAMAKGMWGMVQASLAFIATPVGIILAVLVGAFLLVKNAMNRSEESTNKIKKAFAAFGGIVQGLLKILEPLGEFLIDGLVKGFELVEKGVFAAMKGISTALAFLGFDDAAASMKNFTDEIKESVEASKALAQAEIELEKAQRIARKTQLDFQKDAEKLRQIRDDESKSIAERAKANEELGEVLKQQLNSELAIAEQALIVANLRIQAEGQTKDALDAQALALTEISDIQERITGQESEQLVNRISLRKEAAEQAKKIQEEAIKKQNEELELFIAQQGKRAKTLEEGLEIQRKVSEKQIEILNAELKAGLISRENFNKQLLEIQNDLLQKQAELTVDNERIELEAYNQKNQSKLESDKFLTEQLFEEEQRRIDGLAEKQREFEAKRLEEGVISQTEFNAAINAINEENRVKNEELELQRKEAKAEQAAIDFENKLAIKAEQDGIEFELRQAVLEAARLAEIKEAEKTGADINLINKKFAALQKTLDKNLIQTKLQGFSDVSSGLASSLGENTALGKTAAITSTTVDTYLGAQKAYTSQLIVGDPTSIIRATIAAGVAVASGLANVTKIAGVKLERGAILKGNRHNQGGIDLGGGYEGEDGEAVINRKSTSMFAPLLSRINEAGGGRKLATGGILGIPSAPTNIIDYDLLAVKVAEANLSLPTPVLSVEEFNSVNDGVKVIEQDADF